LGAEKKYKKQICLSSVHVSVLFDFDVLVGRRNAAIEFQLRTFERAEDIVDCLVAFSFTFEVGLHQLRDGEIQLPGVDGTFPSLIRSRISCLM
jgi:hypothetical protein